MHTIRGFPRICVLALLCGALQTWAQDTGSSHDETVRKLQTRMDELRAQMTEIQAELDAMRGTTAAKPPQTANVPLSTTLPPPSGSIVGVPLPSPVKLTPEEQEASAGEATAHHHTFNEDEDDAPRLYNAPLVPDEPGFFLLPGTRTMLRLDGSMRTDFIYDPRVSTLSDSFIPSSIPIPAVPGSTGNFTASIRGSRLTADFLIPVTDTKAARTFIQFDFFGANGATSPRLRHLYAQIDNILVGQTFSNFMDPDAFSDSIDTQGVNSAISVRVPQARYSFPLWTGGSGYVSVELPSSSIDFDVDGSEATPTTPAPDTVLRVRNEWERGHLQLASTFRDLGVKLPDGTHETTFGWGLNATGGVQTIGSDNLILGAAYGHGIARYVGDLAGQNLDAAPRSQTDLRLKAIPVFATYGTYQHFWTPGVRSSATFGYVQAQNTAFQPPTTYHKSSYSSVNLIWNPLGSLDVGAEFLYGWVQNASGVSANDPRFQITGRYTFVKLHPKEEDAP